MKSWIKTIRARLKKEVETKSAVRTYTGVNGNRYRIETLVQTLDPEVFKDYTPDAAIGIEVNTLFPTLSDYCREMRLIALRVLSENMIVSSWADQDYKTNELGSFLTTGNGYYVDTYEVLTRFKDEVVIFCALLHKLDRASYGTDHYNRRLLTKFVLSVEALLNALIAVSLDLSPQV
jgi:hypothetical protein